MPSTLTAESTSGCSMERVLPTDAAKWKTVSTSAIARATSLASRTSALMISAWAKDHVAPVS